MKYRADNRRTNATRAKRTIDGIARIYFVQCESGFVKIGWTGKDLVGRLQILQTGNHEQLRLLGEMRGVDRGRESWLHGHFSHLRQRGEWFRPGADLMEYISKNAVTHAEEGIRSGGTPAQKAGSAQGG